MPTYRVCIAVSTINAPKYNYITSVYMYSINGNPPTLIVFAASIPSVSSFSDISTYSNMPSSVQSLSDESFVAPSSVSSNAGQVTSPPTSPRYELMRHSSSLPPSVSSAQPEMETEENGYGILADKRICSCRREMHLIIFIYKFSKLFAQSISFNVGFFF